VDISGGSNKVWIPPSCIEIARRGVGFLINPHDRFVTAYDGYSSFEKEKKDRFITNFLRWIASQNRDIPGICHGFDKSEFRGKYTDCFLFKYHEIRLYGFLSHPDPENLRFWFFAAVHFLMKYQQKTEERVLKNVDQISLRPEVIRTVEESIRLYKKGNGGDHGCKK